PAPRGVPQIEVTFDIDANGIVHVTAKDKGTGKENTIKIQEGSGLSKEEIDRMIRDAEAHAAEDSRRREEAETRNQAESLVYQTEKIITDNEDKVPADVKDKVRSAIKNVQDALTGSDIGVIKTAVEKLATESQALGQAIYAAQAPQGTAAGGDGADAAAGAGGAGSGNGQGADDDVVDAEVVDEPREGRS
ncbi:molecular chaperone DnaK, partial [Rhodococcus wratislaviensis IFP 2016]